MTTGWLYVSDDGIEWSEQHPVRSGQVPDARLIRRASNKELLSALKDAWEAHGEAVQSEARLRTRVHDAEDELARLNEQVIPGLNAQLTEQFELSTKYVGAVERVRSAVTAASGMNVAIYPSEVLAILPA